MRIRFAVVVAFFPMLLAVAIAETIPANEAAKHMDDFVSGFRAI